MDQEEEEEEDDDDILAESIEGLAIQPPAAPPQEPTMTPAVTPAVPPGRARRSKNQRAPAQHGGSPGPSTFLTVRGTAPDAEADVGGAAERPSNAVQDRNGVWVRPTGWSPPVFINTPFVNFMEDNVPYATGSFLLPSGTTAEQVKLSIVQGGWTLKIDYSFPYWFTEQNRAEQDADDGTTNTSANCVAMNAAFLQMLEGREDTTLVSQMFFDLPIQCEVVQDAAEAYHFRHRENQVHQGQHIYYLNVFLKGVTRARVAVRLPEIRAAGRAAHSQVANPNA